MMLLKLLLSFNNTRADKLIEEVRQESLRHNSEHIRPPASEEASDALRLDNLLEAIDDISAHDVGTHFVQQQSGLSFEFSSDDFKRIRHGLLKNKLLENRIKYIGTVLLTLATADSII